MLCEDDELKGGRSEMEGEKGVIGFLFEWEVGRKMTGKKPRSKHIHAEKKAFHWPHIPSSLFSSYKGESESCGGIQINAGERSGEVV